MKGLLLVSHLSVYGYMKQGGVGTTHAETRFLCSRPWDRFICLDENQHEIRLDINMRLDWI